MSAISVTKIVGKGAKLALLIVLLVAVYQQIVGQAALEDMTQLFLSNVNLNNLIYFLVVLLLMLLNWGVEAWKWQQLMSKIEELSFVKSFRAILCGVTLSMFTPNRVGEYGGRVLLLQKADKLQGVALSLVGSLSQIIANSLMGCIGFFSFCFMYNYLTNWQLGFFAILVSIIWLTLFVLYFNIQYIEKIAQKIAYFQLFVPYVAPITQYSRRELLIVLCLSLGRYGVYTGQYLILLWALGIPISLGSGLMMVSSIFFVQSVLPSMAVVEMGIRGNIALFFLGYLTENMLGILAATFLLWIINLLLPALGGLFLLLKMNIWSFLPTKTLKNKEVCPVIE